jgi:hypothetical protein
LRWSRQRLLVEAHGDLSRLGLFGFRDIDFEDAVPIGHLDAVMLDGLRQGGA